MLDEPSQLLTSFSHPEGSDQWARVPMGVRNGPPHFQRCVNMTLSEAGLHESVGSFIDDLCNGGRDHEDNIQHIDRLLAALSNVNFRLGAGKFELGGSELHLFGFVISAGRLRPDPERVTAISRLIPPANRS